MKPAQTEAIRTAKVSGGQISTIEQLTRQPSSPSDLEWSGLADSGFSETQEGPVDGLLKFRFAKENGWERVIEKDQPDSF